MHLILRANEFRVCKPSGSNNWALFRKNGFTILLPVMADYSGMSRQQEESCEKKNEFISEQGLHIFNWISIQLRNKTFVSCVVQRGDLLPWVTGGKEGMWKCHFLLDVMGNLC